MQYEVHPAQKKSKRIIFLFIGIAAAILMVSAAIGFFLSMTTARVVDQRGVKDELITQNTRVKVNMVDNTVTATSRDQVKSTKDVSVRLKLAADAKSYCIEAFSRQDSEAVRFHMFKDTPDAEPIEGLCGDNAKSSPSAPKKFTLGATSALAASFSWDEIPEAKEYIVQCGLTNAYAEPKEVRSIQATAKIEGLVAGTTYLCRIAAKNSAGVSDWSEDITIQTNIQLLVPKDLKITTISSTSLSYSWQPVPGATRYVLEYATNAGFSENVKQVNVTQARGTLTGLTTDTGYYFHVKAITPSASETQAPYSHIIQGRTPK